MRVAVIGPSAIDDFAFNIAEGLRLLGHEALLAGSTRAPQRFGYVGKAWAVSRDALTRDPRLGVRLSEPLIRRVLQFEPALVITVESLRPETVSRLANADVPVALWFPDAVSNLGPLWMFSAPYRAAFFKEPLLVHRVAELTGLPVHYLPEACNPTLHRVPDDITTKSGKVAVVGNFYATRVRLLERLHADGIPLELYGSPFPPFLRGHPLAALHTGRYVRGVEKARVFRSSSAVLNNLHPAEIDGLNCRLFEAAACGAAVVCEDRRALAALFASNEVVSFSTYGELLSLLRRLLGDDAEAFRRGDAAALRASSEHTYEHRITRMLEVVFGG